MNMLGSESSNKNGNLQLCVNKSQHAHVLRLGEYKTIISCE